MARFWIDCFCWDIEDEGVEAAVGRIKGDLGADELCILVQSDDATMLRSRAMPGGRLIHRRAGAHFRHASRFYETSRIRPVPGVWMKARDPFARIAKACDSLSVGLSVRASCLRNRVLVERHPMAACVNAFGDASGHRLCPANPDVREYVGALASDLAESYPTRCVELSDVTFESSQYARVKTLGIELTDVSQRLLDWCFCPSCRQRAADRGCDVEKAQSAVRNLVDRATLATAADDRERLDDKLLAELLEDDALRLFQEARSDAEASLLSSVRAKIGEKLAVAVNDDAELAAVAAAARELGIALVARHKMDRAASMVEQAGETVGARDRIAARFDAYPPFVDAGPSLVSAVHETVEAGHARIGFYADGLLPPPCLDWVRQAIRYARRAV